MKLPTALLILMLSANSSSAQWVESLASTASLRTYGARLVSSDTLRLDKDRLALITYWEAPRGEEDRDYYRCADIVLNNFNTVSQQCWAIKTPTGRRAIAE